MFVPARVGRKALSAMNARQFRAMADRCRELQRVAARDDIREQLRDWALDFEAEAEACEKQTDYSSAARSRS
jgi:hypothetical protein